MGILRLRGNVARAIKIMWSQYFYRFRCGFDFDSGCGNYIVCIDHLKLSVEQVTPEVQVVAMVAYNIYTLRAKECGG
jgi:hypothetical protein